MDIEFKLGRSYTNFKNVLMRQSKNSEWNIAFKDGERPLVRGSDDNFSFGNLTGKELLVAFVFMINHEWFTAHTSFASQRKFDFVVSATLRFSIEPDPTPLHPANAHITQFPTFEKLLELQKDDFKNFFLNFLEKPMKNISVTENDPSWALSILLTYEIARRLKETSEKTNHYDKIPVATAIMMALDLNIVPSRQLFNVFKGTPTKRQEALDSITSMYVKKEASEMLEYFFTNHLSNEEDEVDEMRPETAETELRETFTTYFDVTIEKNVEKMFLSLPETSEPDKETEKIRNKLIDCLYRFCYSHHGQLCENEDGSVFELSGVPLKEAKIDLKQKMLRILIKEEPAESNNKGNEEEIQKSLDEETDSEEIPTPSKKRKRAKVSSESSEEMDEDLSPAQQTESDAISSSVCITKDIDTRTNPLLENEKDGAQTTDSLEEIRNLLKRQNEMFDRLLNNINTMAKSIDMICNSLVLPLKDQADLRCLEAAASDPVRSKQMIDYLGYLGGLSLKDVVERILSKMLTSSLAAEYNWSGKGKKHGFSQLRQLCNILIEAVRRNAHCSKATEATISKHAMRWFKDMEQREIEATNSSQQEESADEDSDGESDPESPYDSDYEYPPNEETDDQSQKTV